MWIYQINLNSTTTPFLILFVLYRVLKHKQLINSNNWSKKIVKIVKIQRVIQRLPYFWSKMIRFQKNSDQRRSTVKWLKIFMKFKIDYKSLPLPKIWSFYLDQNLLKFMSTLCAIIKKHPVIMLFLIRYLPDFIMTS